MQHSHTGIYVYVRLIYFSNTIVRHLTLEKAGVTLPEQCHVKLVKHEALSVQADVLQADVPVVPMGGRQSHGAVGQKPGQ